MPILKCTRTLVRVLGKSADKQFSPQPDNDTSVLGCWSAHLVMFARMRFVLFVNAKTLLTIFLHLIPKEHLLERFRQALANQTPHVKREHPFPEDYVSELFGVEEQKAIYTPPTSKYAH